MNFTSHIRTLHRYDADEYKLWKIEVRDVLIANNVWEQITDEAIYDHKWEANDALARLIIRHFVDEDLVEMVACLGTAKLSWDFIKYRVKVLTTIQQRGVFDPYGIGLGDQEKRFLARRERLCLIRNGVAESAIDDTMWSIDSEEEEDVWE